MRHLTLTLILLLLSASGVAQSFEWIRPTAVNFNFNPSYPTFPTHYDRVNHTITNSRLDIFDNIYGSSVLGTQIIDHRDTNGNVIWQYSLGPEVNINRIITDVFGDVYVAGQFKSDMIMGGTDTMHHVISGFNNFNYFVIKLNTLGIPVWAKNLSPSYPMYDDISAMALDPFNNIHIACTDFFTARIIMINTMGADILTHTIDNGKQIGNISFDPSGGLYLSGAAEQGAFVMDTDTFFAPHDYNMFIARFNSNGSPAWAHFGHDITFQRPMVVADADGNAFFAGMRFDSLTFNGSFINNPIMGGDFFAFKCDTSGNIAWVAKQPPLPIGPFGTIETGNNLFIGNDASGRFYLGGIQQGNVDWGNGFTTNTGAFQIRKSIVACFSPNGITEWVKMGGSDNMNYIHALSVSNGGSVYFTGSFSDTATFDNNFLPTANWYNFMLGKIRFLPVSLDETEASPAFSFYPNPASDIIIFDGLKENDEITITDLTGRVVMKTELNSQHTTDISALSSGTYLIEVLNDEKLKGVARLVKSQK